MKLYFERKPCPDKTSSMIRIIITDSGEKERISTGLKVKNEDWSVDKGRPTQKESNFTVNSVLNKYLRAYDDYIIKIQQANEIPSINQCKMEVESAVATGKTEKKSRSVVETIDEFLASNPVNKRSGRTMREGALKPYRTLKIHLNDYKQGLKFADINEHFSEKFMLFLASKSKHVKGAKDLQISTMNKMTSTLIALCRWAFNKKKTASLEWHHLHVVKENNQTIVSLHQDELKLYTEFNFGTRKNLEEARDVFVFAAHTGLRYEDLKQVNQYNTSDGYITIDTIKTNEPVRIPLSPRATEILKKYGGSLEQPLAISNQKLNVNIKTGVKLCGIDRKVQVIKQYYGQDRVKKEVKDVHAVISIHDARKGFISIGMQSGLTSREIMRMSAQKDIRTLKAYENYEQKKVDEKMLDIFKAL